MTRPHFRLGAVLAAAMMIAAPTGAAAQSGSPVVSPIAAVEEAAAPAGRMDAFLEGLGFELEVNNDKPKAAVSLGGRFHPWTSTGVDGLTSTFNQLSWNASFSTPIGGEDDLTDAQTLDKLSNGSSVTLSLSRFSFSNQDVGDPSLTGAWQVGGEATVGFNDFDYREPLTLVEHTGEETAYAVGAFVAYYPTNSRSMVSGGVRYQQAFEARDEVVLCRPVVIAPADDCAHAAPGPPEQTEGFVFNVEYRRTFDIGWSFADLAISPITSYDEGDGEFGIELPIYLLPHAKSPILPGIKFGYSSDEDEVTFGFFLKSSFSLPH